MRFRRKDKFCHKSARMKATCAARFSPTSEPRSVRGGDCATLAETNRRVFFRLCQACCFIRTHFFPSLAFKKGWGSSNGWRGPCNLMFARQDFGEHGPSRNAPNAASPFMCRSGRSISTPLGCGICGNAKLAVTALKQRSISPRPDACPPRHSGDNRDNAARFPGRTGWTRRLSHICK